MGVKWQSIRRKARKEHVGHLGSIPSTSKYNGCSFSRAQGVAVGLPARSGITRFRYNPTKRINKKNFGINLIKIPFGL